MAVDGQFPYITQKYTWSLLAGQHIDWLDPRATKQPLFGAIVLPLFKVAVQDL